MPAILLDVSVLFALAWPNHEFHRKSVDRMKRQSESGAPWATCAITELGFVRLSLNPAATGGARPTPRAIVGLLSEMKARGHHEFIPELPPIDALLTSETASALSGHRTTTDIYLALLARAQGMVLLTLDQRLAAASPCPEAVETMS